jgi:hypothetical protein
MSSRVLFVVLAAGLLAGGAPRAQQAPAREQAGPSSKVWIGHEAEYEEFLRTAKVVRMEDVPVGVTHPRRCYFADGSLAGSMVFKPLPPGREHGFFESYKSEIAAYELDKMLGLGMVPPTVERKVKGETGSAQLWVEHCVLLHTKEEAHAPDPAAWNKQVYRQRVWDDLVGNIDRNQGNLLLDPAWNLILIDHSRAFTATSQMPFPLRKIDRELYGKLKALDEATIKAGLGKLLFDGPKPLLKRRDKILADLDALIAQYGEAAVFID